MLAAKLLGASGTAAKTYVDDVFSAYTYTGNGSTQTITNGIDLSGEGGLVWLKDRTSTGGHSLFDTTRGVYKALGTHLSNAQLNWTPNGLTAFNSNGFSIAGADGDHNLSPRNYVSWTFRNADKFYNHTTVVKTGGSNATVSFANLTTLGMVRVKRTDSTGSWYIWHRSLTAGKLLIGETTAAEATLGHITVSGTTVTLVNGVIADGTYLVEGFAHDTGTDGLIQCGSYVAGAGDETITLGWEPQFVMECRFIGTGSGLLIQDSARGLSMTSAPMLSATTSAAESAPYDYTHPSATGYTSVNGGWGSGTILYLAIRRPNKPPTTGTQVYNAIARTGTGAAATVTGVGFAPDVCWAAQRDGASETGRWDRLRGGLQGLRFNTDPELAETAGVNAFTMDGVSYVGTSGQLYSNTSGFTYINHFFKRAPGVMDVVCYTGTGSATTVSHGLGAVPELLISKTRSGVATRWYVYHATVGATKFLGLNETATPTTATAAWNDTAPTSSVFSVGSGDTGSTATHVAYLFATLAGIQKITSFVGNGSSQTIDCGFTTGARFVCIKATSTTGDWLVGDSTRGLVAGNDPRLSLNTTAAEVTTEDWLDPASSGFVVNQVAGSNANVNGVTYLVWAIA